MRVTIFCTYYYRPIAVNLVNDVIISIYSHELVDNVGGPNMGGGGGGGDIYSKLVATGNCWCWGKELAVIVGINSYTVVLVLETFNFAIIAGW